MHKMASDDETTSFVPFPLIMGQQDSDEFYDHGFDHHRDHPQSLSRLSICNTDTEPHDSHENESDHCQGYEEGDDDEENNGSLARAAAMGMFLSRLSIESSGIEADEEVSDDERDERIIWLSPLGSDKEVVPTTAHGCSSLPAMPQGRRTARYQLTGPAKDYYYGSENDVQKGTSIRQNKSSRRRKRRVTRDRWLGMKNVDEEGANPVQMHGAKNSTGNSNYFYYSCGAVSGESEGGGSGSVTGVMVIAKPKGGKRPLCMDLEEVKACRDLGFELEHQRTLLEMPQPPPRISIPSCTSPTAHHDTSSAGSSPISAWRISSPGDDPLDVKARLKVWAQAVALASTSWQSS